MNHELALPLRKQVLNIKMMPAIPAVVIPLIALLQRSDVRVDDVVRLVSYDKSIVAQCLRVVASPLFARSQPPDNFRSAVITLGLRRMRDIALTCSLGQMLPADKFLIDPTVFWKHSLGCAIVCQEFGRKVGGFDPDKTYLAGLLHDIGIIVNCIAFSAEFSRAIAQAQAEAVPLGDAEQSVMGFTHCETGNVLAELWQLPPEIREVIACHHEAEPNGEAADLVALVHLCDLLCRVRGMGYGYYEPHKVDFLAEPAWAILLARHPHMADMDLVCFTADLDHAADEVAKLVESVLAPPKHDSTKSNSN
jgi:putative nucleotidyltransferase with HDIG domain